MDCHAVPPLFSRRLPGRRIFLPIAMRPVANGAGMWYTERGGTRRKERTVLLMERIIICAVLAGYAILVDLQAAFLRVNASSIHDFQVLPLTVWGAVLSVLAVAYVYIAFRPELRRELKKRRARSKAGKQK
jgi:hypothetical protein